MIVSLAEAAKLTGKSRQTIYRRASKGELIVTTREDNSKGVETSELERVFGTITVQEAVATDVMNSEDVVSEGTVQHDKAQPEETPAETILASELERQLADARTTLKRYEETISDLEAAKLKLWDQLASQQQLLDSKVQLTTSLQTEKANKLTNIADDGALYGIAGVGLGAVFIALTSLL